MAALEGLDTPVCGCLSCHGTAVAIIDHPVHGERAVCRKHVKDYPIRRKL